jgi:hypothetical protein
MAREKIFCYRIKFNINVIRFSDLFFCLSLLHKDQLILDDLGILSLKKFKTSKKFRSFLCLVTLIMKYEPYLGEKSFLIHGIISR